MKLLLYPHGGSGNHGCEAIVRATKIITGASLTLCSNAVEQDVRYGLDRVCDDIIPYRSEVPRDFRLLRAVLANKLKGDYRATDRLAFRALLDAAKGVDAALSIGGDNYCYGVPQEILFLNRELRCMGVKTVLWGCSVSPEVMEGEVLDDLRGYDAIIARESITFDNLRARGLSNVRLAPDPAFVLPSAVAPLPHGWVEGKTIGLNASPMIMSYSADSSRTLRNYEKLIEHIVSDTDFSIALIPHVEWSHNDDRRPLRYLFEKYRDTGRLFMVEPADAETLKGYISRCRLLVTARTHASIAAYSSGVPTIVMGYSVKAEGIARDLFGTTDGYVLPVQGLASDDVLACCFDRMMEREDAVRALYAERLPDYVARVEEMKRCLLAVTGK